MANKKKKKPRRLGKFKGPDKCAETIPEEAQTSDLWDKDFKTTVLNMLKELETMDKKWKETGKTTSQQMENSN